MIMFNIRFHLLVVVTHIVVHIRLPGFLLWWAARIPTRVFEAVSRLTHSVTMPGLEPGTSR